jgi:hypothetical protein
MTTNGALPATCANCGAPDNGELVSCKFCHQPISAEIARAAIPCPNPQCRTQNRWGRQRCIKCEAWVVVSCVFCGSLSPHTLSNCLQCNEAFAGAMLRKQQMEQNQRQQNYGESAGIWGNVAASFLGAAAGAAVVSTFDGSSDYTSDDDDYDASDVSDDTDFFGSDE